MPVIKVESLELTDKQKEIIADKYITIFSELTNVPKDRVYLFFDGYSLDSVATNGKLFAENPPTHLLAKFNEK